MNTTPSIAFLSFTLMGAAALATEDTGLSAMDSAMPRITQQSPTVQSGLLVNTNKEPVQFSWAIQGDVELDRRVYQASSRGFWLIVTGADLTRGIAMVTDAPGAAVHVSPSAGTRSLALDALQITDASGARHSGRNALRRFVDPDELRASGVPFSSGSVAFELDQSIGAGRLVLQSRRALGDDQRYVVQVIDRNSTLVMTLSAASDVFFEGGTLQARGTFRKGESELPMVVTGGYLTSPGGVQHAVRFEAAADGAALTYSLAGLPVGAPGLWELNLVAREKVTGVMRTAKTAFALARPTARLSADYSLSGGDMADRILTVGVEVSDAGRYEARAVLLGRNEQGEEQAAMMAASAAWLQPGKSSLELRFDGAKVAASGLRAPFAIADLRLMDQSRMAPLQMLPRLDRVFPK